MSYNHNALDAPNAEKFSGAIVSITDRVSLRRVEDSLFRQDEEVGAVGSVWYLQGSGSLRTASALVNLMKGVGEEVDPTRFRGLRLAALNSTQEDQEAATIVAFSPDVHVSDAELAPQVVALTAATNNTLAALGSDLQLPSIEPMSNN